MSGRGPDAWRKSQCCGGPREEIVMVDIYGDGRMVGLVGLNTIFEELYARGRAPDPIVQGEVAKMVAAKNYVPTQDEPIYGPALVREYAKFCAKKSKQKV